MMIMHKRKGRFSALTLRTRVKRIALNCFCLHTTGTATGLNCFCVHPQGFVALNCFCLPQGHTQGFVAMNCFCLHPQGFVTLNCFCLPQGHILPVWCPAGVCSSGKARHHWQELCEERCRNSSQKSEALNLFIEFACVFLFRFVCSFRVVLCRLYHQM